MAPETTNGRPSSPQAPVDHNPTATKREVARILPRPDSHVRPARATVAAPSGRRSQWLIWVSRCPSCAEPHVHRADQARALLAGETVRACSVTGTAYRIVATRVVVAGATVRGAAS